jgi:hypothetical protein
MKSLSKREKKKLILELLHFWPLSIVVPAMLLLILFGPYIVG